MIEIRYYQAHNLVHTAFKTRRQKHDVDDVVELDGDMWRVVEIGRNGWDDVLTFLVEPYEFDDL